MRNTLVSNPFDEKIGPPSFEQDRKTSSNREKNFRFRALESFLLS